MQLKALVDDAALAGQVAAQAEEALALFSEQVLACRNASCSSLKTVRGTTSSLLIAGKLIFTFTPDYAAVNARLIPTPSGQ
ncbi:hypothetical protein ACFCWG_34180 [Streptomyces sp. NPDC056390]|uniref:hypothetical protein n=1 Tax=Streptomyces sp. NPDC056390 TaxID=3345806 RepID=UPI0035E3564A